MSSTPVPAADRYAAALARAQWREARLEELAQIGMGQVRGLGSGEGKDDTALKRMALRFVRLSRAVRLVLTLADWVTHHILALMRGEVTPEPWRRPRPVGAARSAAAARAENDDPERPAVAGEAETPEHPERPEHPESARATAERGDRFAYASWDEAMHAICNAFDIQDRSRFLESESFRPRPEEEVGADGAEPVVPRKAPAPPRPSPWAPGGALSRRAVLRTSTALPDERALQ